MSVRTTHQNIPEGWKQVTLGDLFDFKNGLNSEKENFGHGIRFINIMEILKHDSLVAENIPGRINVTPKRNKENLVEYGDVLFNRTSETPEEVGMTSVYLDTEPVVFGGFVIRAKSKSNELNDLFKKYCFSSTDFRKEVIKNSQGVVRGNIGQSHLRGIPFLLPPKKEQDNIVSTLETWNQAIEKLRRKIEIKKEIKEGLMKELLTGKTRLPSFKDKWNEFAIREFAALETSLNVDGNKYEVLSCTKYDGLVRSLEYFNRQVYGNDLTKYKIVPKSYFAYATNHIEEGSIGYQNLVEFGLVSPMYTIFRTKGVNNDFLFALLKTPRLVYEYKRHMTASVERRGGLRWESFSKIKVHLPPMDEQNAIADFIHATNSEILSLEKKIKLLKDQKKYLLNNLVTGTIRTPETLSIPK